MASETAKKIVGIPGWDDLVSHLLTELPMEIEFDDGTKRKVYLNNINTNYQGESGEEVRIAVRETYDLRFCMLDPHKRSGTWEPESFRRFDNGEHFHHAHQVNQFGPPSLMKMAASLWLGQPVHVDYSGPVVVDPPVEPGPDSETPTRPGEPKRRKFKLEFAGFEMRVTMLGHANNPDNSTFWVFEGVSASGRKIKGHLESWSKKMTFDIE